MSLMHSISVTSKVAAVSKSRLFPLKSVKLGSKSWRTDEDDVKY